MLKDAKCGCRLFQADQGVGLPPFLEGSRIVSLNQSALNNWRHHVLSDHFSSGVELFLCWQDDRELGEREHPWLLGYPVSEGHLPTPILRIPLRFHPVHWPHLGRFACLFFLRIAMYLGRIPVELLLIWLLSLFVKIISSL